MPQLAPACWSNQAKARAPRGGDLSRVESIPLRTWGPKVKKALPVLLSLICVALLSPWVRAQEIPNAGASVAASGENSPPVPESSAQSSGTHAGGSDTSSG